MKPCIHYSICTKGKGCELALTKRILTKIRKEHGDIFYSHKPLPCFKRKKNVTDEQIENADMPLLRALSNES